MRFFSRPHTNALRTRSKPRSLCTRQPYSALPSLECLEDRSLPSTGWIATGSGQNLNNLTSIATDPAGDTYVAVMAQGNATFGPNITLTGNSNGYGCVAKLDPTGNWLWATKLSDSANLGNGTLAVDSSGNVYVAGYFSGTGTFGPTTLTSAGGLDIFVSKLGSSGNFIWSMRIGGTGTDESGGLALDGSGNLYVAGSFSNSVSFGATQLTSKGGSDAFLTKINSTNGTFAWAEDVGGVNADISTALVVDSAGNAYMSGILNQFEIVDGFDTNGMLLWNYSVSASGITDSLALYTDSTGNDFLYQAGPYNAGVLKLYGNGANAGTVDWIKNFNVTDLNSFGGQWNDILYKVATDGSGNVYVTGKNYSNSPYGLDPASSTAAYLAAPHFVAKLDPSGNFLAARSTGGDAVAVDSSGSIHSFGSSDLLFGSAAVYDTGSQDLLPPSGSNLVVALTTQDEGGVLGRVFADLNNNDTLDANENGLFPVTVYADLNGNGQLDPGEPSTTAVTNAVANNNYPIIFGEYDLKHLSPGTYSIRVILPTGWTQTSPAGAYPADSHSVTVTAGQDVDAQDFGAFIPNQATTNKATHVPFSIPKGPKNGNTTVSTTLAVTDTYPILSLSISTNVSGATGDSFTLISPDGVSSGAFTPNTTVALPVRYFGHNVHGTWTLQIATGNLQPSGTLNSWSITVVGPVVPHVPQIGAFTASSSSVRSGANVTLTVSNISDANANATITQVAFYYLDSSGNKVILGYGAQTSPAVWTLTFKVNLASGTYTLFAQVEDSGGIFSDPFALA